MGCPPVTRLSMADKSYVLVTPARNEEATIEITIQSVLAQSVLPREWVIVSDGSTDRTDEIVRRYSSQNGFIRLLRLEKRPERNFASVVFATESGVGALQSTAYAFLGLLDADVRFKSDYFAQLMARFEMEPLLGLAGGIAVDIGEKVENYPMNPMEVPGAVQFFRRGCFEVVQPLIPVPEGGWDALTCAIARMKGYHTRAFVDLVVDHLKPRSAFQGSRLVRLWHMGERDYVLGYGPLFELMKCASRMTRERPWVIASTVWFLGYLTALLCRRKTMLSQELKGFIRQEQWQRLLSLFRFSRNPRPV